MTSIIGKKKRKPSQSLKTVTLSTLTQSTAKGSTPPPREEEKIETKEILLPTAEEVEEETYWPKSAAGVDYFGSGHRRAAGSETGIIDGILVLPPDAFKALELQQDIRFDSPIGSKSSEGVLFLACGQGDCDRVVKIINAPTWKYLERSFREIFFCQYLSELKLPALHLNTAKSTSPIIPQLYGWFAKREYQIKDRWHECRFYAQLDMVMDRYTGDLKTLVMSRTPPYLNHNELDRLFRLAIVLGKWGIIHGDLKLDNYLYKGTVDLVDEIVITDFGFTGFVKEVLPDHYSPLTGWVGTREQKFGCPPGRDSLDLCASKKKGSPKIELKEEKLLQLLDSFKSKWETMSGKPWLLKEFFDWGWTPVIPTSTHLLAINPETVPKRFQSFVRFLQEQLQSSTVCTKEESIRFAIETNCLQLEASLFRISGLVIRDSATEAAWGGVGNILSTSLASLVCPGFSAERATFQEQLPDNYFLYYLTL